MRNPGFELRVSGWWFRVNPNCIAFRCRRETTNRQPPTDKLQTWIPFHSGRTHPSSSITRLVFADNRAASSNSIIAIPCSAVTGGGAPFAIASATPR